MTNKISTSLKEKLVKGLIASAVILGFTGALTYAAWTASKTVEWEVETASAPLDVLEYDLGMGDGWQSFDGTTSTISFGSNDDFKRMIPADTRSFPIKVRNVSETTVVNTVTASPNSVTGSGDVFATGGLTATSADLAGIMTLQPEEEKTFTVTVTAPTDLSTAFSDKTGMLTVFLNYETSTVIPQP